MATEKLEAKTFYPKNRNQWRAWLQKNHAKQQSVWVVCYKKKSGKPTITWSDAVDEALCFGWIDSIRKSVDDETFVQFFSKRKPVSTWSKINKDKIKKLIAEEYMTEAGLASMALAKKNGSWKMLDQVEKLSIPADLEDAFKKHEGSRDYFLGLSKSVRKMILQWIMFAKRDETRIKRIEEVASLAAKKLKPKHIA